MQELLCKTAWNNHSKNCKVKEKSYKAVCRNTMQQMHESENSEHGEIMLETGRICVKTAGREAGEKCVIVEIKDNFATIDGNVRRKRCNLSHLEPLNQTADIKAGATHEEVVAAFRKLGILKEKKASARKASPAQKSAKPTKKRTVKEAKPAKKKAEKPAKK